LHVNDVAKEFILTSLIHELYANLQNFEVASDMLEFLEVRLGEQYLIPEQDIDTEMAEVVSIQSEILTLKKKNDLFDAEVDDQSKIDEILIFMIHSFEEFRRKVKGKEVCFLFKLVSVEMDSMMEPEFGMIVGEFFFSELKGKEEKKETKEAGKVVFS
jgi:hypothetical protein